MSRLIYEKIGEGTVYRILHTLVAFSTGISKYKMQSGAGRPTSQLLHHCISNPFADEKATPE
jgi:hypothetical protein